MIERWFCCLNPRERSVLRASIEGLLLTLWIGIPSDLWEAFWFGEPQSGAAVRSAFLSIYGLEIVTIVPTEGEPAVEVVRPVDLVQWVSWSLFLLTPAAACLSGCQLSRNPSAT